MTIMMRFDGTDRFQFHPARELNGRYVIYPRGHRDQAVPYKNDMIIRDGKPCGPTWATGPEVDELGGKLFA